LLHGFNSYYAADFPKAIANFNSLDRKDSELSTIALLGLAQSYFMLRKYETALEHYKRALISNKNLPVKARLGMAYCFFELEKYELAQKCFERILKLAPKNTQAYMGLAVICYRNGDNNGYFNNLKNAYHTQPNDPLVLVHLTEHYLFAGEYKQCLKLSTKGLEVIEAMPKFLKRETPYRDDYEVMKARLHNLMGQVHHAQGEYDQAKMEYERADNRGLRFNSIGLAQVLMQANLLKESLKIFEQFFSSSKPTELKLISDFFKTFAYLQVKAQVKHTSEEESPATHYKEALKYNKHDYDTLIDYSVLLCDTNDKKQGIKILQLALKAVEGTGREPKPELLNNIAVYLIEEKQYE
jgi:RNA polymerase-associated protein CTR9